MPQANQRVIGPWLPFCRSVRSGLSALLMWRLSVVGRSSFDFAALRSGRTDVFSERSLRVRSTFVPSASPRSGGIARRTIAAKGFHSPSASELLSLAWPRESNQREGHPKAVVSGLLSSDFATGLRGFADSTSVCWQRTGRDPSRPPCGPFLRPAATAYGTLVARILRARAKSNVKSVGRSRSGCESSGAGGKGPEE